MPEFKKYKVFIGDKFVDFADANLSVASSAVLYGLSVYTVFPINKTEKGLAAFRLKDHFKRLQESSHIIGIDKFNDQWTYEEFTKKVKELVDVNNIDEDVFIRASVHVDEILPGTRSRNLSTVLSMFIYPNTSIVPRDGCRLKTSLWRRVPDTSIPARAKVNGAYVNSVLAKQDAIDSGYDDCIFLDHNGHVSESSAANVFIVRNNTLITPDKSSDLLEGINRKTVLEIARSLNINVEKRLVDLTELYIADEVFLCGTSAYISPVVEVDSRKVGKGDHKITSQIQEAYLGATHSADSKFLEYL